MTPFMFFWFLSTLCRLHGLRLLHLINCRIGNILSAPAV